MLMGLQHVKNATFNALHAMVCQINAYLAKEIVLETPVCVLRVNTMMGFPFDVKYVISNARLV
jgi:hypothetical protein